MLIAKTMTMLTDGDKALALATAGAYRSLEREKRLWAQERHPTRRPSLPQPPPALT